MKLKYCGTCGAPMGPDGMIAICQISGEQCVECCGDDDCQAAALQREGPMSVERLAALLREWFGSESPLSKGQKYAPQMAAWLTERGVSVGPAAGKPTLRVAPPSDTQETPL